MNPRSHSFRRAILDGSVAAFLSVPEARATVMGLLGLVGWRERRKPQRARQNERTMNR